MADAPPAHRARELLYAMTRAGASDLHLRVGVPPTMRLHGRLMSLPGEPPLDRKQMSLIISQIITAPEREALKVDLELDMAYQLPDQTRFRVNVFLENENLSASFRRIPQEIPAMEDIGLPDVMRGICDLPRGLVLITGPTGSGKTTTLASMLDRINHSRDANILTIEDPVEFVHEPAMSFVRQREVGRDTHSFARALKSALRQDPDVILVGEMRDLETIETALTAAETGHLVFSTLHTRSAPETINRIIDVFPGDQQSQVRAQLASSLACVLSQTLLPRQDIEGRVAAFEVLIANDAARNAIREDKIPYLRSVMQTGRRDGMQTMDMSLSNLVLGGVVDVELARERAQDRREIDRLLSGGTITTPQMQTVSTQRPVPSGPGRIQGARMEDFGA